MSLRQANDTTKTTAIIPAKPVRMLPDESATITPKGNPNTAVVPQAHFRIGLLTASSFISEILKMLQVE
jgi:hypothetical protein